MPVGTDIVHSVSEVSSALTGRTAPSTGIYYTRVYGQSGAADITGVPTLNVTLVPAATATPVVVVPAATSQTPISATSSSFSWFGVLTVFMFAFFIGIIYALIRMWQNYQAQHEAMLRIQAVESDAETLPAVVEHTPVIAAPSSWRDELERMDARLGSLLSDKGVVGETMGDKLKAVSAGQFTSIDLAWEAHQSLKALLSAPESEITDTAIMRAKSLYKQVFADHGVV